MSHHNLMRGFLSGVVVMGFMVALIALFRHSIPASNEQLLSYMLGQLSGYVGAIMLFEFGSSRGSEAKTELLNGPPPPANAGEAARQTANAADDRAGQIEDLAKPEFGPRPGME